jgi:hypothetical protein
VIAEGSLVHEKALQKSLAAGWIHLSYSGAFLRMLSIDQTAKIHDRPLVVIKLEVELTSDLPNSP